MAKTTKAAKGPVKKLFILLALFAGLLLVASVVFRIYSSGETELFKKVEYNASTQNSQVLHCDELDMVYLGTYLNSVLAYDVHGNPVWSQDISGAVSSMEFDTEQQWLIVGSQDRNVYVYQAADGQVVNTFPVNGKVYDLDYDQQTHRLLVSAGINANKHTIYVLDLMSGEELLKMSIKNTARAAKFSADKQAIIYGDARGRLIQMDLEGNTLASEKMRSVVYGIAVAPQNGAIYALDEGGFIARYDEALNQQFIYELTGEGRCVGVTEDGQWVGAGTREGDIYILDADGTIQYSLFQSSDVSQVYFGTSHCYVATLSPDLYEFSEQKLNSIGLMSILYQYSLWAILLLAALTFAFLVAAFPGSSAVAGRFFHSLHKHRTAYLMLLPSIVLILIFNYYNVFQAFYYAFTDWSLATRTMREVNFVGLDNFTKMFSEGYFLLGVKNLLIILIASFLKLVTIPLLLAEIVYAMRTSNGESSRRRYWFRLLLVMPMVVPGVVSTLMWKNIYDPNIGALNSILDVIGLSEMKHSWLGDASTALGAIIFMGFPWVNSFAFLVYYGGLTNIPGDLFEAAKIDGSNPWWNFTKIHLPLITPQLKMLIITTFIGTVQDYGGIFLLTQGGPGTSTYVPGLELYFAATKFGQYGYACAMGLIMFIVILIGSLFNLRMKTQELN